MTDRHALISAKVLEKIGVNTREKADDHKDVHLIIIDRLPHITKTGLTYLLNSFKSIFIVTNNQKHPAFKFSKKNMLQIIFYPNIIDFKGFFCKTKARS